MLHVSLRTKGKSSVDARELKTFLADFSREHRPGESDDDSDVASANCAVTSVITAPVGLIVAITLSRTPLMFIFPIVFFHVPAFGMQPSQPP